MTSPSVERSIAAAPERVFALSTDLRRWPEVVPAIVRVELLSEGPVGVGTRLRETRVMFGREASEEMEIVEFDAPRGYVMRAESHGCRYRTAFRFEPGGQDTRVVMAFDAQPLTLMAKLMAVLMKPMMKEMTEMCARDLEAFKAHAEAA